MIGPLFIHVKKDFATYHFFASSLVSRRVQLTDMRCFGTDGEEPLVSALSTAFPRAIQLRCFLHFHGNLEHKLHELSAPAAVAKQFIHDVLGNPAQLERELVDAASEDELDGMLANLEEVWNERERQFNSPPVFYSWFMRYCRDVVSHSMLRPVRESARLGSPPEPFYTNEVESKNNILKQQVSYKHSELPVFVDPIKGPKTRD